MAKSSSRASKKTESKSVATATRSPREEQLLAKQALQLTLQSSQIELVDAVRKFDEYAKLVIFPKKSDTDLASTDYDVFVNDQADASFRMKGLQLRGLYSCFYLGTPSNRPLLCEGQVWNIETGDIEAATILDLRVSGFWRLEHREVKVKT
jgi:hypothetical protein